MRDGLRIEVAQRVEALVCRSEAAVDDRAGRAHFAFRRKQLAQGGFVQVHAYLGQAREHGGERLPQLDGLLTRIVHQIVCGEATRVGSERHESGWNGAGDLFMERLNLLQFPQRIGRRLGFG